MSATPKIAYVTKYALTSGMKAFPVEDIVDGRMAVCLIPGPGKRREYYHGLDWHLQRDDAIARAEDMRVAKIASLRKQIAKLEALSFDVVDEGGE